MFFDKPARKKVLNLNLVALIDITALIIIFLIMGTIFGETSVVVPTPLQIPKSVNKDVVEPAPQIILFSDHVLVSFFNEKVDLSLFESPEKLESLNLRIKEYIKQMPERTKKSGVLLNVIADKNESYKDLYDVIRFFRQAGFQSVLFIAQGE